MVKNPDWRSKPVGFLTSMAGDLNSGLQESNPASGQGGTWPRRIRITSALTTRPCWVCCYRRVPKLPKQFPALLKTINIENPLILKTGYINFWDSGKFRERLSQKKHTTIPKGIVGDLSSLFFKEIYKNGREVMDVCLRVLKKSNKSRFDSYNAKNGVLIISHVTFRDCRVHMFFRQLFSK